MLNLLNALKAFIVCALSTGLFTLYTSTSSYQAQLAREGQEVGKIEALMHYSTLSDVWSRMFYDWLQLFVLCFMVCLLLLLWIKTADKSTNA